MPELGMNKVLLVPQITAPNDQGQRFLRTVTMTKKPELFKALFLLPSTYMHLTRSGLVCEVQSGNFDPSDLCQLYF